MVCKLLRSHILSLQTSGKSKLSKGSPKRQNPEEYYGHVYIDKKMFGLVLLFAERWEHMPIKSAVYQLLCMGFRYYIQRQLQLETARQTNQPPTRETGLINLDALANFLAKGKGKKILS